ncbi:MAG: peptide chain release factor-like protein [Planctomycetales bacterium]|nr:peptide chain release factor-like protein [Planctomycetales bacterium]
MTHPAACDVDELLADCALRRQRRSGPGGQHRNKVETAVVISHMPTGVCGAASERRSQEENRQAALFRLRVNLALEVRSEVVAREPSPLWQSRAAGGRLQASPQHGDFPALLAEALDQIDAHAGDVAQAAAVLNVTPSQLVKFLRKEPRALAAVNARRKALGVHELK